MKRIWDISPAVGVSSPVFPGDAPFTIDWSARVSEGDFANVSILRFSPHIWAHVDSPMHLDSAAPDVAGLKLETFIGRCRVVDLSQNERTGEIGPDEFPLRNLPTRVLVKTRAKRVDGWSTDYRPISPALMRRIIDAGVVLLGVDMPSVDPAESTVLPSHRIALAHNRVLMENLDLSEVPAGDYELIALPLRLSGAEASPVRAVLRSLTVGR